MPRKLRADLIAAVQQAFRLHGTAADALDEAIADYLGINRTDLRCIDILERLQPMTAGDLAHQSGLTTGAVTAVLDRLERAGYIRRVRDEADRRRVFVELVDTALERAAGVYAALIEWSARELGKFSDEQLEFMLGFIDRGREFLEQHAKHVREIARQPAEHEATG